MRWLVLVLAACGSSAPSPRAPAARADATLIPRGVLFGNPDRTYVQLSPDGTHLSWLAPVDGVLNVWVAPRGAIDQARPVTTEKQRPIHEYHWAYTNAHIIYAQDTGGDENYHLLRTQISDGATLDLTPYPGARAELSALDATHPGSVIVELNDRDPKVFDVYTVDVVTGARTLLARNDDALVGFSVDHDLAVRFGSRKLPDGATEVLERAPGGWRPFATIPFEDETQIVGFSADNQTVYLTETRGRDTAALVELDLRTHAQRVLAEDPRADAGAQLVHPTTGAVQAVAFEYDRTHWKVLDPSIAPDLDALAELDGGEVSINTRTEDDTLWLAATTSELHPRRYYVWDRVHQRATFLFDGQPALSAQPLVTMHPVEIRARDGLALVSYLSLPAGVDPDGDGAPDHPVPLVLWVHGGPWTRDSWGFDPVHQLLANRGYAVLSVNYRGSKGFGKKFLNAANLQWGRAMQDDLSDAVRWAIERKIAVRERVCIIGGSYGGYATLAGMTMTPELYACGVDIVGPSNLETFLAAIPAYWAPMRALLQLRVGDASTAEGRARLSAASPLTHVASITHPLLIAQGANDPRVKRTESEQIVAAMKQRGLPVTYAVFPDEGHGFARPENWVAFFAISEAFIAAHLGGSYLPVTPAELAASSMTIVDGRQGIPGLAR